MATKRKLTYSKRSTTKTSNRKGWTPTHVSQDRLFQETFVYLMANVPFFFLNKFGISDHTKARCKNVSETTPGLVWSWLALNLAFGLEVEQLVHRIYKFQNVHFWTGSGRTEWFVVFSPIVGISMLIFNHFFDVVQYVNETFETTHGTRVLIGSFFTPFVWWDGLLWLIFFRGLKFMSMVALIFFAIYAIAHMKK